MRYARAGAALLTILLCMNAGADESDPQKITMTGTLSRVMAIGAETTGWMVQVDSETMIDGKPISSIEVSDLRKPKQLEELVNKRVKIAGKVTYRHGIETGVQPYVEISSIKEADAGPALRPRSADFSLLGSNWLLENLIGDDVINSAQATLTFPEAAKVGGNGSCNRFFGPASISGDHLTLGPLASSRMACPDAIMNQETKYLQALQAAQRFEWKEPYLLIYCNGQEKPLRFTRLPDESAHTPTH